MQVTKYLFQSPYSSPVQFGRVDPTTKESSTENSTQLMSSGNETASKAEALQATQKKEVTPSVSTDTGNKLDIYA